MRRRLDLYSTLPTKWIILWPVIDNLNITWPLNFFYEGMIIKFWLADDWRAFFFIESTITWARACFFFLKVDHLNYEQLIATLAIKIFSFEFHFAPYQIMYYAPSRLRLCKMDLETRVSRKFNKTYLIPVLTLISCLNLISLFLFRICQISLPSNRKSNTTHN
jgi:hypothetical protein